MPTLAEQQVPLPTSGEEFENIVRDALRLRFDLLEVSRQGAGPHTQNGVDLFAQDDRGRWLGVQCRNTDVTFKDVEDEVAKAENFKPALAEFFMATTRPRSVALQERVRVLSDERRAKEMFRVHVLFWPDIIQSLATSPRTFFKHFPQAAAGEEAPQRFQGLTFEEMVQQLHATPVQCKQYLGDETSNLFQEICRHLNTLEQQPHAMSPILNAPPLWHFVYAHIARPLAAFGLTEAHHPFSGPIAALTEPHFRLTSTGRQFALRLRIEASRIKVPDAPTRSES